MKEEVKKRPLTRWETAVVWMAALSAIINGFLAVAEARDFSGSVQSLGGDIRNIIMVIGPLMLAVAGAVFYFSKQQGVSMLVSALIGTVVTAASSTIFLMLYRAFN